MPPEPTPPARANEPNGERSGAAVRAGLALAALLVFAGSAAGFVSAIRSLGAPPDIHLDPLRRGRAHFTEQRFEAATREFEIAADILATDPGPLLALASTLERIGADEARIDALREARRRSPDDARTQFAYGTALAQRGGDGDLAAARSALERALELAPGNIDALVNLGGIELRARRPRVALTYYERALGLAPEHAEARNGARRARDRIDRDERPRSDR